MTQTPKTNKKNEGFGATLLKSKLKYKQKVLIVRYLFKRLMGVIDFKGDKKRYQIFGVITFSFLYLAYPCLI